VLQLGLDQGDTKPFWKYVRAQRQDNIGVAPFLDNGVLHTDSLSKACILNKQFVSVFTREEVTDIPKLHGPNYPDITDLGISTEEVEKLLSNLNVSKVSRPDLIPCRLSLKRLLRRFPVNSYPNQVVPCQLVPKPTRT